MSNMDQKATSGITPEVIQDQYIPILSTNEPNRNVGTGNPSGGKITGDVVEPREIQNAPITTAPIAKEVVSFSFDTLMRRILGVFTIGQVGGISDLLSVPILDRYGLNSVNQFPTGAIAVTSQATSNNSYIDVPGATLSFTLKRTAKILVFVNTTLHGADSVVALNIDAANQADIIQVATNTNGQTASSTYLVSLAAGAHILKLQFYSPSAGAITMDRGSIRYVSLGK